LRKDPVCARIPVIVISADATRPQIKKLRNAGAADYLTKPLDINKFMNVLDRTLEARVVTKRQSTSA
jgi:CheY-like chemotaxis protein